jgi:hypothetical protein
MARARDEERERRIDYEITVDAYGPDEVAMSWHISIGDAMNTPFRARCRHERSVSPLREGEEVTVVGMTSEDECMSEMFVLIEWEGRTFGVPLVQLEPIDADEETEQIVADWHYWVEAGYRII